jgi:hypothetical protein
MDAVSEKYAAANVRRVSRDVNPVEMQMSQAVNRASRAITGGASSVPAGESHVLYFSFRASIQRIHTNPQTAVRRLEEMKAAGSVGRVQHRLRGRRLLAGDD